MGTEAAMAFHILLAGASWSRRIVPCHERGHNHRHKKHKEDFCSALCGQEIIRDRNNYCNIAMFNPSFSPNWCPLCIEEASNLYGLAVRMS